SVADRYGAKVGSEIILRNEELEELHLRVTGVFENHVYNYIFVYSQTLDSQLDNGTRYNSAYVNFPENSDVSKSAASISKLSDVTGMTLFSDLSQRLGKMMSSLDYIVLLIIVCAAGLAFVVIYNLTNINITERTREIATIKVLGFFRRETSAYVLRENLVLTGAGALAGLILGIFLHRFVMDQIVVDMVDFRVKILPLSFVLSIVLTFVFNIIVDLFMELKLEKINMAESLKSVD
ncbi:MAG TPA: ABC transporter permease, partial [Ruminococcus sp.]|nr:ABC transporter permease [Ruminococcus sp.]